MIAYVYTKCSVNTIFQNNYRFYCTSSMEYECTIPVHDQRILPAAVQIESSSKQGDHHWSHREGSAAANSHTVILQCRLQSANILYATFIYRTYRRCNRTVIQSMQSSAVNSYFVVFVTGTVWNVLYWWWVQCTTTRSWEKNLLKIRLADKITYIRQTLFVTTLCNIIIRGLPKKEKPRMHNQK